MWCPLFPGITIRGDLCGVVSSRVQQIWISILISVQIVQNDWIMPRCGVWKEFSLYFPVPQTLSSKPKVQFNFRPVVHPFSSFPFYPGQMLSIYLSTFNPPFLIQLLNKIKSWSEIQRISPNPNPKPYYVFLPISSLCLDRFWPQASGQDDLSIKAKN